MNVLIITQNIKPTSGWGRYSYEVVKGLEKKRLNIFLLLEKIDSKQKGALLFSSSSFLNFLRNILMTRRVARACEIVHALDGWPYGIYGFFAVLGTRKKLFINGVGTYSVAPLYSLIKGMLLYFAYKKAQRIFCISHFTELEIAKKTHLQNLKTVHLGSTRLPTSTEEEKSSISAKYHLTGKFPILLTVGQIKDRKGQYEIVQAIKILKITFPFIHYLVVGSDTDGSYVDQIRKFLQENNMKDDVQIISNVTTDKELSSLYELSTIVLLTSNNRDHHFEGFGLVLLEANQFGKPVIGSKDSGIEDAIRDGYNGLLSVQRSPSDIAKKVIQIMDSYELFSSQAKKFEKNFSWNRTIEAYIREYLT